MNGAIHSASPKQRHVRGIYDRCYSFAGDVADSNSHPTV
jgi:hypothetical protein